MSEASLTPSRFAIGEATVVAKPPAELVRFAQRVLNAVQSERLDDDGDLGRLTRAALARFRAQNALGPGDALDSRTVVALAQRALEELAQQSMFPQLGVRDARTESEIIGFKSQRGLGIDSTITESTQRALGQEVIRRTVTSTPLSPSGTPPSLRSLTSPSTKPTVENALNLTKLICAYHQIPWRLAYTILVHEGGVKKFEHPDGVMQTIKGARDSNIPRIPSTLKLALLDLPSTVQTTDQQLNSLLQQEFARRLAVQVATGIQELKTALVKFNGYVALAFSAYNTGSGSVGRLVTAGKSTTRPRGLTDKQWEEMCRIAAAMLHQRPEDARVEQGIWLCDPNLRNQGKWIPRYGSRMYDKKTGVRLVGLQYLRSIRGFVPSQGPTSTCDFNIPKNQRVQPGSGQLKYSVTRFGALDKLYDPQKLGHGYYSIAKNELTPIVDDGLPLKVSNGKLLKVRTDGSFVDV